jgi:hypothetical protein
VVFLERAALIKGRDWRKQDERRRSRRLSEIERAVKGLIALVESGADPQSVLPRLKELESERECLRVDGQDAGSDVIQLHPGIADRYRVSGVDWVFSRVGPIVRARFPRWENEP